MQVTALTFVVAAGKITKDDGIVAMIQGLDVYQAQGFAECLALATGTNVHLRHGSLDGDVHLKVTYADLISRLERSRVAAQKSTAT